MPGTPTYIAVVDEHDYTLFVNRVYHTTFGYRVRRLTDELSIDQLGVCPALDYMGPPWTMGIQAMYPGVTSHVKSSTDPDVLRALHVAETSTAKKRLYIRMARKWRTK